MEYEDDDLILQGWIIELSANNKDWSQQRNMKVYDTEASASKALVEIMKVYRSVSYYKYNRIRPVYKLSHKLERYLKIKDIIR